MMQLEKTSPGKALKALYVLPLVLIGIASNANTVYDLQDVRVVSVTDTLRIHGTGTQGKNVEVLTVFVNGKEADTEIMQTMPAESIASITVNKEDGDAKVYITTITDTLRIHGTGTQVQDRQIQKVFVNGKEVDSEILQTMPTGSISSMTINKEDGDAKVYIVTVTDTLSIHDSGIQGQDRQMTVFVNGKEADTEIMQSMPAGSISSVTVNKEERDAKVQVVTVVGTSSGDSGDSSSESSEQVASIILNGTVDASELGSATRVVADLVKVYVNGENVDASELDTLDHENIESIEVDKQGEVPVIKVTLKSKR